jgi:hypothetical protein
MRSVSSRLVGVLAVGVALFFASPGVAQVDCSNPNNLCTGDPCVIPSVEVASPCVADFGARALVILGPLRVPDDGLLSLTARTVSVTGKIADFSDDGTGAAEAVTLSAAEDITVSGSILHRGIGDNDGFDTTLIAGTHVTISGRISLSGGDLRIDAADGILLSRTIASSRSRITMTAGGDVGVFASLRKSWDVSIDAGGTVWLQRSLVTRNAGTIEIRGAAGVRVLRPIRAFLADVIIDSSAGDVVVQGPISVVGGSAFTPAFAIGGVEVTAAGAVLIFRDINASAPFSLTGGTIRLVGNSVELSSRARLRANGPDGGEIRIKSTGGDVVLGGPLVAALGQYRPQEFSDGGIIEATAAGNLTAIGKFRCAPEGGCVAFNAGGVLDTSGATFDKVPSLDCPGSPSGAFVDTGAGVLD